MIASAPRRRWLWPWLYALSVGIVGSYPFLWHYDVYVYFFGVSAGGLSLLAVVVGLVLTRIIRQKKPWIDLPALGLIVVLAIAHAVALGMTRTINWC